jgi:bis(5'-nucleosyl)-tetraphosphatase (symmetrical)
MATYCIGDVHGCYNELSRLLDKISFDPTIDQLRFVGDLVNRGKYSLETLRLVKSLPNTVVTLGNHDLHLIALFYGAIIYEDHQLAAVLQADDGEELVAWLKTQPLLYNDPDGRYVLTHAGIYPLWTAAEATEYAREVEIILANDEHYPHLLKNMYGNEPNQWSSDLVGWDRKRFIVNAFTRMRFCDLEGNLDFHYQGKIGSQPKEYVPWFSMRKDRITKIICGHWAALEGRFNDSDDPNIAIIDTGCVWGKSLSALRIEGGKVFQEQAK